MRKISLTEKLKDQARGAYFENISWWDSEKVKKAHFLVVGAGALGNEVLKNLALLDVGQITVTDFDDIEFSNLTRSVLFRESDIGRNKAQVAADRVLEINPSVQIEALSSDIIYELGLGYFKDADVVICCVDNRLARLFINRYSFLFGKTWINGAIENLMGRLEVYTRGKHCYESNLTEQEWQNIRFRLGCADVARRSEALGRIPTTPISASIIGAWQVQEALKVVHNYEKHLSNEESVFIEGLSNTLMTIKNPKPKETMSSIKAERVLSTSLDNTSTVQHFLETLKEEYTLKDPTIMLRHEVVEKAISKESETAITGPIPSYQLAMVFEREYPDTKGEDYYVIQQSNRVDARFFNKESSLAQLGVPDWDILQVVDEGTSYYVQLNKSMPHESRN